MWRIVFGLGGVGGMLVMGRECGKGSVLAVLWGRVDDEEGLG